MTSKVTTRERCEALRARYYDQAGYPGPLDRYRELIARYATAESAVLDAGCGATMPFLRELAPHVRLAVGVDLEALRPGTDGPLGCRADVGKIPFRDETFDLIISMSVVEHLEEPVAVFSELRRLLKPGGTLIVQTPNRYDYVSLIAHWTPFAFHRWVVPRVMNRQEEDVFPTRYRANTRAAIVRSMRNAGLNAKDVRLFNQYPAYLMFSTAAFRLGIAYERLTTKIGALAGLRGWILAIAERPRQGQN